MPGILTSGGAVRGIGYAAARRKPPAMTQVNPSSIHSALDRRLRDALFAHPALQRALRHVDENPGASVPLARRRRLLSNALRLTRSTAPVLMAALDASKELLGHTGPVEVFVHPEPMIRSAVVQGPPETPALVLSSGLLEVCPAAELRFVLGRALGHLALGHFAIPVLATVLAEEVFRKTIPRGVALMLYPLSQAAKASADRAGLLCARDPEAAMSALFKLASGLSTATVKSEFQLHLREVDTLLSRTSPPGAPGTDADALDSFSTHPFSPWRLRALVAFSQTRTFRESSGQYASDEGLTDAQADELLERELRDLEPSATDLSERAGLLGRALELGERLGVTPARAPDVQTEWEQLLARVARESPLVERARLVQHITWMTATTAPVTDEGYMALWRLAETVSVPAWLVDEALRGATHPLD